MKNTRSLVAALMLVVLASPAFGGEGEAAPPPPDPNMPTQVKVSVKIVEFQITRGLETGLSAYFARRQERRLFNRLPFESSHLNTADLTFPMTNPAITVFLDRINMSEGDLEVVLQALASESRATILSRPRALVKVQEPTRTIVKTVTENPYENLVVVGQTTVTTTDFKNTGVTLAVSVPELTDDDSDWYTQEDSYIKLFINADVNELGSDIDVQTGITAPSFSNRMIETTVWARHGQMLILGGLYRNQKNKQLTTVPWLSQAENVAMGTAEQLVPGNITASPLSSSVGNRRNSDERRELVFFIKTETWLPTYVILDEHQFDFEEDIEVKPSPVEIVKEKAKQAVNYPLDVIERVSGESLTSELGSELDGGAE